MFPLRDTRTSGSFPFVNYLLILANIVVFFIQLNQPNIESFITAYGFVPAAFDIVNPATYGRLFSSMFMHGGVFHILSNLWFLHIFGDNVEDGVGHIKYLFIYLACGVAAALAQFFISPGSTIPMIGASGAIAGISGMYLVMFSRARILALVPTFFGIMETVELPAWFFLGYWFFLQVFSGVGSLTTSTINDGGIAFFAHIGGFVAGSLFGMLFGRRQ